MGTFQSLNVGLSGVLASQSALMTVGHNLSNMNTEGFSRQRVVLQANQPLRIANLQYGQGVNLNQVQRVHDEYVQQSLRTAITKGGQYEANYMAYNEIEMLFNETEGMGLGYSLTQFWDSWHDLANAPTDTSQEAASKRSTVIESANFLINTIQGTYQQLNDLQAQYTGRVDSMVNDVNSQLQSLATLNTQIAKTSAHGNPAHDLLDQRDMILNKLAEYIDIKVDIDPQGQATVFFDGKTLVDRDYAAKLINKRTGEFSSELLFESTSGHTSKITNFSNNGQIGAYMEMRDKTIPGYIEKLDDLSRTIIEEVNKVHANGMVTKPFGAVSSQYSVENSRTPLNDNTPFQIQNGSFQLKVFDPAGGELQTFEIRINEGDSLRQIAMKLDQADGVAEGGLFSASINADNQLEIRGNNGNTFVLYNDTSNALTAIGLNTFFKGHDAKSIGVNSYVAEDTTRLATSFSGEPGDNRNANLIAELRNAKVMGGMTIGENYNHFVSKIGMDVRINIDSLETTQLIRFQIEVKRESISGVNENEELTNMLKFQRSFEASSRFITTIDRLLDNIVNRMGV
ncbi:flagellar hook-associated protein FlgK [Desulfurispirillum indicum S5]|uniref:Flagellar hook-associated protein 1 n=1 Tax=Desulfurispirillum indicum (strain ATCC BAA-1389 / DSM 22839 / S5) TaxID=653733 RepID=E6W2E1_DESIS|nr:flagellar hook-associated protein FlgK [Desulfurispirillum indicum]ADU66691.1 flagellar hook-associated protein FlgK [Desulfurispirillum indicum S5]